MRKYLLDEYPLIILPGLAKAIGLNEAIVLQQMHYWLQKSTNEHDGYVWIYNSLPEWTKQFPFWSESTVKRTINSLRSQGILITSNYNKKGFDKTLWYRIDYDVLDRMTLPSGQNDPTYPVKMTRPIPETTTETTAEVEEDYPAAFPPTPAPTFAFESRQENQARRLLESVCGVLTKSATAHFNTVEDLILNYGIDKTKDAITEARARWIKTPRQDGKGYYSPTNYGFIDWAVAALSGSAPWGEAKVDPYQKILDDLERQAHG